MRDLLEQIQATLDSGVYATALISALSIPDAAGAVEYPRDQNGRRVRNGDRYRWWYDNYVQCSMSDPFRFDGDTVWFLRNAMLHEASTSVAQYGYDRVVFTLPRRDGCSMHLNVLEGGDGTTTLNLDLVRFCSDIMMGARRWLDQIMFDAVKQAALETLFQYRANGLALHVVGMPVFA